MTYTINFVKDIRQQERQAERRELLSVIMITAGFGVLFLAVLYAGFNMLGMRQKLAMERDNLKRISDEYRQYNATKTFVTKDEVALLDRLQRDRIYWTRIIAPMAQNLPPHYWITSFEYENKEFLTKGFGYIQENQEQLITLDTYLHALRADTAYGGVFPNSRLNVVERRDEEGRQRVAFEFYSRTH